MVQAFEAILEGSQLHWLADSPRAQRARVVVVVQSESSTDALDDLVSASQPLNWLSFVNSPLTSLAEIDNPIAWQRAARVERELPGRAE